MRLTVPSVKGIDAKTPKGVIGQLLHHSETVQGELTRFVLPSRTGWKLALREGRVLYVFAKAPTRDQMPSDGPVLLGDLAGGASDADLSGC